MRLWEVSGQRLPAAVRALLGFTVFALVVASGGCGTTTETPLPGLGPVGASSLTNAQQKMAIQELNNMKATHEQDAIRHIEQSR